MALSLESLITSYSISLNPAMDFSIRHWVTGECFNPSSAISVSSASLEAIPPPVPPIVNAGRTITGYPILLANAKAPSTVFTISDSGTGSPSSLISSRNRSLSSARLMAESFVPKTSTLHSFKIPAFSNSTAILSPVCPPNVGSRASGRSFRIMVLTNSSEIGSI